ARTGSPSAVPSAAETSASHDQSGALSAMNVLPDLVVIAEGQRDIADDLAGLMALAGHQQYVTCAEHGHARRHGLPPVADLARAGRTAQHLGTYRRRVLAARIVIRDDDDVRALDGDAPHDWPLATIAVAATADDADELA